MKEDRLTTLLGVLTVITALLAISVGRFIMGGIRLLLAFGIFWNRGGGKFNDRSLYEKLIRTDLSIADLFAELEGMQTPLGKPWIAVHKGFEGDSIVFGPSAYKDCVIISRRKRDIDIKHITLVDNIIRKEEDEYRFSGLIDASEEEVTPEHYAKFAGLKLASVVLMRHLLEIVEGLAAGQEVRIPEKLDVSEFFYHNSSDGYLRSNGGDAVLEVRNSYHPFRAAVLDTDGNEMASVMPRSFNGKGIVIDSAGYDMYADGTHFGDVSRFKAGKREGFIADTEAGKFTATIFPACRRANISCNYLIEKDGELKAVIGGSPNILFEKEGYCQNDLILSYDDDYLVLYAALEIFIMTLNKKFLK